MFEINCTSLAKCAHDHLDVDPILAESLKANRVNRYASNIRFTPAPTCLGLLLLVEVGVESCDALSPSR